MIIKLYQSGGMIGKPKPFILCHPNIPKPLHGVNPRTIKGQEWWDIERKKAYQSTNYHCAACGVPSKLAKYHQWLEGHELYKYDYRKGRLTFLEIVPLCHSCHNYIHSGRLQILVDKGECTKEKQRAILTHGDDILFRAFLKKPDPPKECASWSKWRMIIDGKEYAGKFKSIHEWHEFYNPDSFLEMEELDSH